MDIREQANAQYGTHEAESKSDDYVERFVRLSGSVERFLVRSIVTLAVLLALSQLLLAGDGFRQAVSPTDRAEGVPLSE